MMRIVPILATLLVVVGPSLCLAAHEGEGEHGYSFFGDLSFWSLVTFIGFIWVIRKLGWQSFVDGLNERERKENEAIEQAERKNRQAQEALIERKGQLEAIDETTRALIDEAHRDAERTRSDIVASARNEAETLKKRALRDIERTRDQSLKGLFEMMATRVIKRTQERIIQRLTFDDQQRLMDESLTEFAAGSPR